MSPEKAKTGCLVLAVQGGETLSRSAQAVDKAAADGDKASKNLTNWAFGNNSLWEIADYFGRPIQYLHSRDYQRATPAQTRYVLEPGEPVQVFKAVKDGKLGAYRSPDKFQVDSAGPDGKLGTSDDIQR